MTDEHDGLTDEEKALREQGLATGTPNLLGKYQDWLHRNPPKVDEK